MTRGDITLNIKEKLKEKFIFFDGAIGTMLQKAGLELGALPEIYNITNKDIIVDIHKQYIDAGADIISTNTFGSNRLKLSNSGYTVEEIVSSAVKLARLVAKDKMVALDIGPTGELMEPSGSLSFNEAYDIFKEQIIVGDLSGADLIILETFSDLYEAKAAILAAKENSNLPIICTMTYQRDERTLTGTDPLTMINVLEGLGVNALGINCSLGPEEMQSLVDKLTKYSTIPIIVQPNAGLPKNNGHDIVYDITKEEFSNQIKKMAKKGVGIFGGCCGTTPEYINLVKESLKNIKPIELTNKKMTTATSSTKTVVLGNEVKVIGERINPTGKKALEEALKNNDLNPILEESILQRKAGADILDINIGLPDINEKDMMVKVVKKIQSINDIPLQIDSTDSKAIEVAVREYNGKPIINSVNGKKEVMEEIFPIVKKYGTCVVALTLDEKGIPSSIDERIEIAERIINTAKDYGIPKENILIDCLVLTASTHQNDVLDTIKAVSIIREKYNVKTILGISNISFGLPERQSFNSTYLTMALTMGLDAPIVDPLDTDIMDTVATFKVLANQDKNASTYIENYNKKETKKRKKSKTLKNKDLKEIIIMGLKERATEEVENLLCKYQPIEIIDSYIVPALDKVGELYEKSEIFLPQLIQSSETVKEVFNMIKREIEDNGHDKLNNGKILLATVEGDIHDIGKNIVKLLLENYGYEIIDLGKNVSAKEIVRIIERENINLIGLSALMTTTVSSMEKIIKYIKGKRSQCKVMVGGAVLNEKYAKEIGADFYAKDGKDAVKIAEKFFEK